MNNLKTKEKGITLIALVITIIVLLILAGVSIVTLTGENGLVTKASWSKFLTEYSTVKEAEDLYILNQKVDKQTGEIIKEKVATLENVKIGQNETIEYPVDMQNGKIENDNINETLNNTIKQVEKIEQINEETVSLYKVNLELLNLNIKNEYVINIKTGELYRLIGEEYERKIYHRPDYGVDIEKQEEQLKIEPVAISLRNESTKTKTLVAKLGNKTINNTDIEWKSSDTSKLSINGDGEVTGNAEGKATITGTLNSDTTKIATLEIEVTDIIQYIYTKEDMEEFRDTVNEGNTYENKTVYVKRDIDLQGSETNQWEPVGNIIGNTTNTFSGTFEGENHTISGVYLNKTTYDIGLFGYIEGKESKNAEVNNVIVEGDIIGTYDIGAVVGRVNYVTINNCINKANVTATGYHNDSVNIGKSSSVGGIAGRIGTDGATIENCKNYGTIKGNYAAIGGIVGWVRDGKIIRCENNAEISNNTQRVGGIVGTGITGDDEGTLTIQNCTNNGNITGNLATGGIIGTSNYIAIENSINNAEISGSDYTGGIIGEVVFGDNSINNCTNNGRITSSNSYIGGIVGWMKNGNINSCYNHSNIQGNVYVGGISGKCGDGTNIGNIFQCKNTKEINGVYSVAGIVGWLTTSGKVEQCVNLSNITSTGYDENYFAYTGGITGHAGDYTNVLYSYNIGNIESNCRAVGGITGNLCGNIKYCYSIGDITNNNTEYPGHTGGIIGSKTDVITVNITDCMQLENCIKKGVNNMQENVISTNEVEKSAEDIKNLTWDNYSIVDGKNEGYPVLTWEYSKQQ